MAKTESVYARIEPELKKEVEEIFADLDISTSTAINMFYRQVRIRRGIPFDLRVKRPPIVDNMSEEEFIKEIEAGIEDIDKGKFVGVKDFFEEFKKTHDL